MKWKERCLIAMLVFAIILLLLNRRNLNRKISSPIVKISEKRNTVDINIDFMNLNKKIEDNNMLTKNGEALNLLWESMHPWDIWHDMVKGRRVTPESQKYVNLILKAMASSEILKVDKGYKGTQLKAVFYLDGPERQKVVFKPRRYSRDKVLSGTPYEGYDRHNAEIAAFHLDRILGFYRAPPAVGRFVNLKTQVVPVCKEKLLSTFFHDGKNLCFFGKCHYCNKKEPACAVGNIMEGSLTLWIPKKWRIDKTRHPWQRTYKEDKKAVWETDDDYCESVQDKPPYDKGPRLLDIMDTAVYDFLIGNADRHHYEILSDVTLETKDDGMLLHMDNGKRKKELHKTLTSKISFGNPHKDEISILAPLYQCCRLRKSTYGRLLNFWSESKNTSSLSSTLNTYLQDDPIYPVLNELHLKAIDRRLKIVLDTIRNCFNKKGEGNVLLTDVLPF